MLYHKAHKKYWLPLKRLKCIFNKPVSFEGLIYCFPRILHIIASFNKMNINFFCQFKNINVCILHIYMYIAKFKEEFEPKYFLCNLFFFFSDP